MNLKGKGPRQTEANKEFVLMTSDVMYFLEIALKLVVIFNFFCEKREGGGGLE